MKIAECSYCGVFALTDQGACENCWTALGMNQPDAVNVESLGENIAPPNVQTIIVPPENIHVVHDAPPITQPFPLPNEDALHLNATAQPYQSPLPLANCLRCGTPVPHGQIRCSGCDQIKSAGSSKGFSFGKIGSVLAVAAVLICGFFVYKSIADPGAAILAKYAAATGADDSIAFKNFTLSGEAKMVIAGVSTQQIMFNQASTSGAKFPAIEENFAFTMLFEQPNKTAIEFTANDNSGTYTAFKQVFDGTAGWKFTNIRNRSPRYEDSDDAFAEKKMGMGLEEYDSVAKVEMADEKLVAEYGLQTMQYMSGLSTFYVDGAFRPTEKKVLVLAKKKHNGKTDATLMFFDEKSGFLIGMMKKALVNGEPVISKIFTDHYNKFPVKKKGLFGERTDMIYIPTHWRIETEPGKSAASSPNPGVAVTIYLDIKKVDIDTEIKPDAFSKS